MAGPYVLPAHRPEGAEVARLVTGSGWILEDDLRACIEASARIVVEDAVREALRRAGVVVHAHPTCHGRAVAAYTEDPGEWGETGDDSGSDVTCSRCIASMQKVERGARGSE